MPSRSDSHLSYKSKEIAVPVYPLEGSASVEGNTFGPDARLPVELTTSAGSQLLVSLFVWSHKDS